MMSGMARRYVVGDVHGHLATLTRVLHAGRLIDDRGHWHAATASLAVLGDRVDRGPDGVGVIELLMRLEQEAESQGGRVQVALGNHDVLLLAAARLGDVPTDGQGFTFERDWLHNGGNPDDLARLSDVHRDWLLNRPAMIQEETDLLVHADATFYASYGASVADVNAFVAAQLNADEPAGYQRLLGDFEAHDAFLGDDGGARLEHFLTRFGAHRLIHGHSPIARVTNQPPENVHEPFVYAEGRAVNVDPGLYRGGPGFLFLAAA
jgi:hypothetical protein